MSDFDQTWVDDYGQALVNVHRKNASCLSGCVIHAPTNHVMKNLPRRWRGDTSIMERICPHGVGHPDPDAYRNILVSLGEEKAKNLSIHACDGCCTGEKTWTEEELVTIKMTALETSLRDYQDPREAELRLLRKRCTELKTEEILSYIGKAYKDTSYSSDARYFVITGLSDPRSFRTVELRHYTPVTDDSVCVESWSIESSGWESVSEFSRTDTGFTPVPLTEFAKLFEEAVQFFRKSVLQTVLLDKESVDTERQKS